MTINSSFNPYEYQNSCSYSVRSKAVQQGRKGVVNERLFQQIADHQYLGSNLPLTNKIVGLHCTKAGGFGDISQTFLFASKIRKNRPDLQISIRIECDKDDMEKIESMFPTHAYQTEFINFYDYRDKTEKMKEFSEISKCMIGVAVPIFSPVLFGGAPARTIKEYGFGEHLDSKGDTLSMGINPLLEEGIPLPDIEENHLYSIETPWAKQALHVFSPSDEAQYVQSRKLYSMYVSAWWSVQMIALYSVAEIEKQNLNPIDVFLPLEYSIDQLVQWGALDLDVLRRNNIGKITLVTPSKTESVEIGEGKEMRIFSGPLSKKDMEAIQQFSEPFFGCTGNLSMSEGIVLDKVLFYGIPDHQLGFDNSWNSLLKSDSRFTDLAKFKGELTEQFYTECEINKKHIPKKVNYYQEDPSYHLSDPNSVPRHSIKEVAPSLPKYAERITRLYLHGSVVEQSRAFNTLMTKEYNFEPRLMEIVSRGLLLTNYPHLIKVESDLHDQFLKGEKTETQVVEELTQALRSMPS